MTEKEFEAIVNSNHCKLRDQELDKDVKELKRIIAEDTSGQDRAKVMRRLKMQTVQKIILGIMAAITAGTAVASIIISAI